MPVSQSRKRKALEPHSMDQQNSAVGDPAQDQIHTKRPKIGNFDLEKVDQICVENDKIGEIAENGDIPKLKKRSSRRRPSLTPLVLENSIIFPPTEQACRSKWTPKTEIIPGHLHVGARADATSPGFLSANRISAIVTLGERLPEKIIEKIGRGNYLQIDVRDSTETNLKTHFKRVNEFVKSKKITLVHCQAGISRSASCAIGYLMWSRGMRFREAYEFVQKKRHVIEPNFSFVGQLEIYGRELEVERASGGGRGMLKRCQSIAVAAVGAGGDEFERPVYRKQSVSFG